MRISEIRQELESYGISTSTFLEKREMMDALKKARDEGRQPTTSSVGVKETKATTHEERRKVEMENAQRRKVGELKVELERRGISTKSFLEKSDFVKAYVDAIMKEDDTANFANDSNTQQQPKSTTNNANDPSYRDVIMYKMDKRDPRLIQGRIIDVRLAN
jgi:DNA primase large subunit